MSQPASTSRSSRWPHSVARDAEVVHLPRHDDDGLAVDADLAADGLDHEEAFGDVTVTDTGWRRAASGPVSRTISPSSTRRREVTAGVGELRGPHVEGDLA